MASRNVCLELDRWRSAALLALLLLLQSHLGCATSAHRSQGLSMRNTLPTYSSFLSAFSCRSASRSAAWLCKAPFSCSLVCWCGPRTFSTGLIKGQILLDISLAAETVQQPAFVATVE